MAEEAPSHRSFFLPHPPSATPGRSFSATFSSLCRPVKTVPVLLRQASEDKTPLRSPGRIRSTALASTLASDGTAQECWRQKEQHVAAVLLFVLPAKSLTINTCCRVANFPDQASHLALRGNFMFLPHILAVPFFEWLILYSF
jgi:hypothetical protein